MYPWSLAVSLKSTSYALEAGDGIAIGHMQGSPQSEIEGYQNMVLNTSDTIGHGVFSSQSHTQKSGRGIPSSAMQNT